MSANAHTLADVIIAIGLAAIAGALLVTFCRWACGLYDHFAGRAK